MTRQITAFAILIIIAISACTENRISDQGAWLEDIIDEQFVFEAEGNEDIPSIDQPQFTLAANVDYLADSSIVLGVFQDGIAKAYPLDILHWHEIVNDVIGELPIAITYSTLSGCGIAYERVFEGALNNRVVFELGVTGLLFNANLIAFDRLSGTDWLQIRGTGVRGLRIGQQLKEFPIIEMKWASWRLLFPNSEVLNLETGFNRPYESYPYGDYRTDTTEVLFSLTPDIDSLDRPISYKDKVMGVIVEADTIVFPLTVFPTEGIGLIAHEIGGRPALIVGSQEHQVMVAYDAQRADGSIATFQIEDGKRLTFRDERGVIYNIFGQSNDMEIRTSLVPLNYKTAFWFNWAVWSYPSSVEIYE